ncbi:MAG: hypothetical protein KGH93_03270 [Patescibacteria group bacterium]|nr:hypothetical protein [Patescibacteria group bacterium]
MVRRTVQAEIWKRTALVLLSVVVTFFATQMMGTGSRRDGNSETPTGWTVEQAYHFLQMPPDIKMILEELKQVFTELDSISSMIHRLK